MAVDEFGRELPPSASSGPPDPPSPRHRSRSFGDRDRPHDSHRSISPSPSHRRRRRGDDRHREGRDRSYSVGERRKRKHPSEKYVEEPLLCQFVWEQQLQAQHREAHQLQKPHKEPSELVDEEEANKPTEEQPEIPPLFSSPEEASSQYLEYTTKFCLNYVRTFFNAHLDDPWFRLHLSPLAQYRLALSEKSRASAESMEFRKEILHSLEEGSLGVIPKKDPDCPDYLGPPKCSFVSGCRLGVGTKPTVRLHGYDQEFVLQGEDRNRIERHAKCHLHSFIKGDAAVKIESVPPHVTEEMILTALGRYCEKKEVSLWSGGVNIPTARDEGEPYHRTIFVSFPNRDAKEGMLDKLNRYNEDHSSHRRRDRERLPRSLELEVDCTDVYGRKEVDADGRGGGPAKKKDSGLPVKTCVVNVSTGSLAKNQPVSVLSAAVSSRERIRKDRESVTAIAKTLDIVREITRENHLSNLLRLLYPSDKEWEAVDDEDVLDVSIAYLRRVHLFSFYNGCTMAKSVGSVLAYSHPVGTIHLRLRNADDILKKMAEDRGVVGGEDAMEEDDNPPEVKDMLVMRLNDSIAKALEHVKEMSERGTGCLIDEETDAAAKQIESAERQATMGWLENHGIIDEDGRARCSFHWCKKLFKDKDFLQKHLLKKHSDHLRAECAKCHDQSMMVAWDRDENRPVPPVLVDCGAKFGNVPSAIVGSDKPTARDPEPQLWKEEEERMAAEEERRRLEAEEEERLAEEERRRAEQRRQEAMAGEKRKSNFVDVDDMVEEKVELKMEDVIVAPPPKKKKKKKLL